MKVPYPLAFAAISLTLAVATGDQSINEHTIVKRWDGASSSASSHNDDNGMVSESNELAVRRGETRHQEPAEHDENILKVITHEFLLHQSVNASMLALIHINLWLLWRFPGWWAIVALPVAFITPLLRNIADEVVGPVRRHPEARRRYRPVSAIVLMAGVFIILASLAIPVGLHWIGMAMITSSAEVLPKRTAALMRVAVYLSHLVHAGHAINTMKHLVSRTSWGQRQRLRRFAEDGPSVGDTDDHGTSESTLYRIHGPSHLRDIHASSSGVARQPRLVDELYSPVIAPPNSGAPSPQGSQIHMRIPGSALDVASLGHTRDNSVDQFNLARGALHGFRSGSSHDVAGPSRALPANLPHSA
ncbi:hypothetical protein SeMB42_g02513 [Synchytrium endobioticum]|uniref:Uncharacterized protein n=1 Tax=Synchytrium endobioticum TaxID=286115 RepID=A0A507DEH7_9FUNG|nr:hypothetical protein SeLEV6574_g02266 [Synchytrium endobioticum]TPX49715.1 hypothetical protein SeMB42_g02513 [Synchytrium endobioticum]